MSGQHEKTDAHASVIGAYIAWLMVLILVSMAAMWGLFRYLAVADQTVIPTPMEAQRVVPPAPRLQVSTSSDLEQMRRREQQLLSTYGWVSREAGVVRIPIDRAIELTAERGARRKEP